MSSQYVYVNIDTYRCNGCGTCAALCPEVFRMGELSEKAELADGCVALSESLEKATSMCPEKCIELEAC